jgi:hypothetical protein
MSSKAKFFTTLRNKKISLWVELEGAEQGPWNIWDLTPKECTAEVMKAVQSAFERGIELTELEVRRTHKLFYVRTSPLEKWEDRKDGKNNV